MVPAHIRQSREVLCSTEEWRAEVSLTTYRDCTRTGPPYRCSRPLTYRSLRASIPLLF